VAKDANSKDVNNKKHFFRDFKAELKKVIWPTPKQIVNNTIAVITIVIIAAVIVFALDLVFDIINSKGINKLKADIRNKTVVENNVNEGEEEETASEDEEDDDTIVLDDDSMAEENETESAE